MRALLLTLLFAMPALARPPKVPPIMRMDELEVELANLYDKLRKEEAFAAKPRQERLIIRFQEGAATFEGKKITDRGFVEDILVKWQAVQKEEAQCTPQELQILSVLPGALKARYEKVPTPKAERYQASRVLVKQLLSKHDIIRKTAINCLEAVYGKTLLYRHDASPGQRKERYRKWLKEIDKARR